MIDIIQLVLTWITCLALIATLVFVVRYTRSTKALAQIARREYQVRTAPVISMNLRELRDDFASSQQPTYLSLGNPGISVEFENVSDNAAFVQTKLSAVVGGREYLVPNEMLYGQNEFYIQAHCDLSVSFRIMDVFRNLSENDLSHLRTYRKNSNNDWVRSQASPIPLEWIEDSSFDIRQILIGEGLEFRAMISYRRTDHIIPNEVHTVPTLKYRVQLVGDSKHKLHMSVRNIGYSAGQLM